MINCLKDSIHVLMSVLLSTSDADDDHEEVLELVDGHRNDVVGEEVVAKEDEGQIVGDTLTLKSSLRKADSNSTEPEKREKKKVQWVDVIKTSSLRSKFVALFNLGTSNGLKRSTSDADDDHEEVLELVDGHRNDVVGEEVVAKEDEGQIVGDTLTLKSSLRKADSNSTEPEKREKKKVQWVDVIGKKLAEIREFEPSEEDDIDSDRGKTCVCVIL